MSSITEVKVPDIGDFKEVEIIEILVDHIVAETGDEPSHLDGWGVHVQVVFALRGHTFSFM